MNKIPTVSEILDNLPEFTHINIDMESLMQERDGPIVAVQKPRLYQVETTAQCGLRCGFCPRTQVVNGVHKVNRKMSAHMSLEKFESLLDKMPWVKSLEPFHFGEPFLTPDFHLFIRACKRRGIYTVVASNLVNAPIDAYHKAFAEGLDFLVMDIDSIEKEAYEAIRIKGKWERLREVTISILSADVRPYCVVQSIGFDGEAPYTEREFLNFSEGNRPDEYRLKFLDSFRGTTAPPKPLKGICREPFYGFTVQVNGDVVVCDRDFAGENVMGNIFEQSVEEIWNGPKYQAFRAAMLSDDKPSMCKNCSEGELFNARSQEHIQVNMFKGARV